MSPALAALMAPVGDMGEAENFSEFSIGSQTRPGLGQRQLPQSQQVFTSGRVY